MLEMDCAIELCWYSGPLNAAEVSQLAGIAYSLRENSKFSPFGGIAFWLRDDSVVCGIAGRSVNIESSLRSSTTWIAGVSSGVCRSVDRSGGVRGPETVRGVDGTWKKLLAIELSPLDVIMCACAAAVRSTDMNS